MAVMAKDPGATLDYRFDWSANYLQGTEKLLSASFSVSPNEAGGLVLGTSGFNDISSWANLSGGLKNHRYRLTCSITTDSGRADDRSLIVRVQER